MKGIIKNIVNNLQLFKHSGNSRQKRVGKLFHELFFTQYYYLSYGACEADFAERMGITQAELTDYIEHRFGVGFNALCDRYRVERFVDKIGDPNTENLTINTLIKASGFSNYESFATAVGQSKYKDSLYKLQQF